MLPLLISVALAGEPPAKPSFDHDHQAFSAVLVDVRKGDLVDYSLLATRGDKLDAYLGQLAVAPVGSFSHDEQLAFYINAYNALTLDLVLDNQPLKSIRDLDGGDPWKARKFQVGGETLTLDQIENERVRKLGDGRIHAALNCASVGCPPLQPVAFAASTVDLQLGRANADWLRTAAVSVDGDTPRFSKIFDWYQADFVAYASPERKGLKPAFNGAIGFIEKFGSPDLAALLTGMPEKLAWQDYDWTLNAAR